MQKTTEEATIDGCDCRQVAFTGGSNGPGSWGAAYRQLAHQYGDGGARLAWIEIHQSLKDHRKLLSAADALDMAPVHVMGHVISLWLWALDNAPSGDISAISARNIARVAQWEGPPEKFVDALVGSGLVDQGEDGLFIHDWGDYAGRLIDRRATDRARKRQGRQDSKDQSESENVQRASCSSSGQYVQRASCGQDMEPENVQRASCSSSGQYVQRASCGQDMELLRNSRGTPAEFLRKSAATVPYSTEPYSTVQNKTLPHPKPLPASGGSKSLQSVGVGVGEVSFEEFWAAYPRQVGKKEAAKAWRQIKPRRDLADQIIAGVERWKRSEQWTKDESGRFIPYPATFLHGERWKDEVPLTAPGGSGASPEKNYDDIPDFLGA